MLLFKVQRFSHLYICVILAYKSNFLNQLLFKNYFSLIRNDRVFLLLSVVLKYKLLVFGVLLLCSS